ncbi:MAG: transporter (formate/nitrite transporter family protein) [Rhodobacteraceae bacterium]|nr:transporter (formate/nitrite transporter family protein) [Paracoccaceae bacterium]MBR28399.1 transporter (formate/nitrite transporter family protein) [Paracoccaceae bacterium]
MSKEHPHDDHDEEVQLDAEGQRQVEAHSDAPAEVVYEAIRRQGIHEIGRPASALWWSGFAAGLTISLSVLAEGILRVSLPDEPWRPLVSCFGYSIGFLIVVQARMQLFTENTITPILPLFLAPGLHALGRTARLWAIVLVANLAGCAAAAAAMTGLEMVPADLFRGALEIARSYASHTPWEQFVRGVPAGFLVAAMVWILPRHEGSGSILIIVIVTWLIGVGEMSHVVVGSTKLFMLAMLGEMDLRSALMDHTLPALAGNVIGGTGIFAALTFAQVREEV